ncbi:MAG TPA: bifunctional UDP-N-acetylglucosamine diphosphorylase/glucosamine-1-phosphate N-acetyltransferase GlmU [Bacillales bacterium]|nr:bifunctional UDP-N-acetylglucosamine diphosphorylase/glucosamine-1-phosphate N-acetyltransferase GlmU [Bacillales bacterium]
MNRFAVILAAGQGTRMKSKLYKVLHPVCGKPMVEHVIDHVSQLEMKKIVTIIGHGAEKVKQYLGSKCDYALQEEQLGTAHAVRQAESVLGKLSGTTLVICGDTPLITPDTLKALLGHHTNTNAKATILTAYSEDPTGYGRIIRSENGSVEKIVEHKDASVHELTVKEINTGTYCFDNQSLFLALKEVKNENVQGEFYLPDVIEILKNKGETIAAYQTADMDETLGVNDRIALAQAENIMKHRINKDHMKNGVTIIDPANTYISAEVIIGNDTTIYPGTVIRGQTVIGSDCNIGPNSEIDNCKIGERTVIRHSAAYDSEVGNDVKIGPFAHIRPQSTLHNEVKIGNFVEVKKSVLGTGSKVSHLSYIGDAEVGTDVNIGCGSITVNYDGEKKHLTKIEDGVFVGCNSNLVAPVTIGRNSFIAAGSTITENVPESSLSIARARQMNKVGYMENKQDNK